MFKLIGKPKNILTAAGYRLHFQWPQMHQSQASEFERCADEQHIPLTISVKAINGWMEKISWKMHLRGNLSGGVEGLTCTPALHWRVQFFERLLLERIVL